MPHLDSTTPSIDLVRRSGEVFELMENTRAEIEYSIIRISDSCGQFTKISLKTSVASLVYTVVYQTIVNYLQSLDFVDA